MLSQLIQILKSPEVEVFKSPEVLKSPEVEVFSKPEVLGEPEISAELSKSGTQMDYLKL
jgi:hypothetical protein